MRVNTRKVVARYFHQLEDEPFLTQTIVNEETETAVLTLIGHDPTASVIVQYQDGKIIYSPE